MTAAHDPLCSGWHNADGTCRCVLDTHLPTSCPGDARATALLAEVRRLRLEADRG